MDDSHKPPIAHQGPAAQQPPSSSNTTVPRQQPQNPQPERAAAGHGPKVNNTPNNTKWSKNNSQKIKNLSNYINNNNPTGTNHHYHHHHHHHHSTKKMADPFEVRMRFTNQLRQLNASVMSAQKAAQFALKHHEMGEDLHSCILEQLEKNNMNTRANIMYFIEHFLDLAQKESHPEYVVLMQRDIIRVVDAVAPEDGTGIANVKVARKVLQALAAKSFLDGELLSQIEEVLRERYSAAQQDLALMSSPTTAVGDGDVGGGGGVPTPQTRVSTGGGGGGGGKGKMKLDRKQVEQRIEEDRERHKRQREGIWAVSPENEAELRKLWEETSELGEDDERMCDEEWEEWEEAMGGGCGHWGERTNGDHHS